MFKYYVFIDSDDALDILAESEVVKFGESKDGGDTYKFVVHKIRGKEFHQPDRVFYDTKIPEGCWAFEYYGKMELLSETEITWEV